MTWSRAQRFGPLDSSGRRRRRSAGAEDLVGGVEDPGGRKVHDGLVLAPFLNSRD